MKKFVKTSTNSSNISEIFLTFSFEEYSGISEAMSEAASILKNRNASVFQDRYFIPEANSGDEIASLRKELFPDSKDLPLPSVLSTKFGGGISIQAFSGLDFLPLQDDGKNIGVSFSCDHGRIVSLPGIIPDSPRKDREEQAREIFYKAERFLVSAGLDFNNIPRTWLWLNGILDWYDDFNIIRNSFYKKKGLLCSGDLSPVPASTGIGIESESGLHCSLDLIACSSGNCINFFRETDKQKSPCEYGSAFSRASSMRTPAGRNIYISGTAALDRSGNTINPGKSQEQIKDTFKAVRAALEKTGCSEADMVQANVYCRDKSVYEDFLSFPPPDWPFVPVAGTICRDDLLFEIDCTAFKPE
ncbi:MAG: Rid family hydrolase [Fibrobacterota bacterium]